MNSHTEHRAHARWVRPGTGLGAGLASLLGMFAIGAQVVPGEKPAEKAVTPPVVSPAPLRVVRPSFPSRSNPMPGRLNSLPSRADPLPRRADPLPGGPRRDTPDLYQPVPTAPSRGDRPAARPEWRGFRGPGAGGSGMRAGGGFSEASGFSADLAWDGDRFSLAAHLGSGLTHPLADNANMDGVRFHRHPGACYPINGLTWPYLSWPYNHGRYPYDSPYYSYYYTPSYYGYVYGSSWPVVNYAVDQYADPALSAKYIPQRPQQVQPPVPPPTAMELATAFMQVRRYGEAVGQFRAHLKTDPGDQLAARWMGVAQLLAGKIKDGSDTVGKAYQADPALGDSTLNLDEMGVSQLQVRELCGPVVAYARRSRQPGAYVSAAMLMQVRTRADLAIKMLTEAKSAGLDPEVYARLSQSMTK